MAVESVSLEFAQKLIEVAVENGYDFDEYTGVLMDSYIFYDVKDIKITGIRRARYIILKETYLNHWSSELQLIVTDSEKKMLEYREMFEEAYERVGAEDDDY